MEQLAARGGLSPQEAAAVINGLEFRVAVRMSLEDAVRMLRRAIADHVEP